MPKIYLAHSQVSVTHGSTLISWVCSPWSCYILEHLLLIQVYLKYFSSLSLNRNDLCLTNQKHKRNRCFCRFFLYFNPTFRPWNGMADRRASADFYRSQRLCSINKSVHLLEVCPHKQLASSLSHERTVENLGLLQPLMLQTSCGPQLSVTISFNQHFWCIHLKPWHWPDASRSRPIKAESASTKSLLFIHELFDVFSHHKTRAQV